MKKRLIKILLLSLALGVNLQAQTFNNLFRTKDRPENMEAMDTYKFTYGFYLAANNFDYKMVLNPTYGTDGNKTLLNPSLLIALAQDLSVKCGLMNFLI
jgi:hypothetical protein